MYMRYFHDKRDTETSCNINWTRRPFEKFMIPNASKN